VLSRSFVVVVEMMGLEPTTPCLQSQIGQVRCLGRRGSALVEAALALSVVVRSGPVRTAVNGTLVARPVRMFWIRCGATGSHLDRRVRLTPATVASLASRCRRRGSSSDPRRGCLRRSVLNPRRLGDRIGRLGMARPIRPSSDVGSRVGSESRPTWGLYAVTNRSIHEA
jgi:hypothetical protein